MAKAVQSHPPSPSPKHETAISRNSIEKWYIIWGLDNTLGCQAALAGHGLFLSPQEFISGYLINGDLILALPFVANSPRPYIIAVSYTHLTLPTILLV